MKLYKSKIGRLSYELRDKLNRRIQDGYSQAEIIGWLSVQPEVSERLLESGSGPISPANLSEWVKTGYAQWCNNQERTEHLARLTDASLAILSSTGGDPSAVGTRLLAGKLLDLLEGAADDTADLPALVSAMTSLRTAETAARRVEAASQSNALKARALALEEQRFRRETCELFKKWYDKPEVRQLLGSESTSETAKTEALGELLFGDLWASPQTYAQ